MAGFYVFGVPDGEQMSKCAENTRLFLQRFDVTNRTGIHKNTFYRKGNEAHYVFLVYPDNGAHFMDANGRSGSYFGMDFVLHGKYSINPIKIFNLLQETYNQYVKGNIIQEFPNGNKKWLISNLDENNDKIARDIAAGVQHLLQTRQDLNLAGELRPIAQTKQSAQHE